MKIVSFDLETTGLNEENCQIIEIGAVVEDTLNQIPVGLLPKFHCYLIHDVYQGEPYALAMHQAIFKRIAARESGYSYLTPHQAAADLNNFLRSQIPDTEKYTITGKNAASFDLPFFKANPYLKPSTNKFHHRVLDVGSLYFNPDMDKTLPSTAECLVRAGLPVDVKHNTIDDCVQIITLIRRYYEMKKQQQIVFTTTAAPMSICGGAAGGFIPFNTTIAGGGGIGFNTSFGVAGAGTLQIPPGTIQPLPEKRKNV